MDKFRLTEEAKKYFIEDWHKLELYYPTTSGGTSWEFMGVSMYSLEKVPDLVTLVVPAEKHLDYYTGHHFLMKSDKSPIDHQERLALKFCLEQLQRWGYDQVMNYLAGDKYTREDMIAFGNECISLYDEDTSVQEDLDAWLQRREANK